MLGAQILLFTVLNLLKVPSIHQDQNLTFRANQNGITFLCVSKFKTRYTGCKRHAVDINGVFREDAAALVKEVFAAKDEPQKKTSIKMPVGSNNTFLVDTKVNDLSTNHEELLTENNDLSTKKAARTYSIKKSIIRQRLLSYLRTQKGKKELYFWTVTFPEGLPDAVAYRIYNIWLTSLRQYRMLKEYLWIAERQQNGTIHFHIAIPHKMPVHRANAMLAGTLKTFSRKGEISFSIEQCKRYNGVDIAKNRNTKRVTNFAIKKGSRALANYLTKYVTKNAGGFPHLAWHNSRGFSSLFTGLTLSLTEYDNYKLTNYINASRGFVTEFFAFIPWKNDVINDSNSPPWKLMQHLDALNNYAQSLQKN